MKVPFVSFQREYKEIKKQLDKAYFHVMANGYFILGHELAAFEKEWAAYLDIKHAIGVGDGTNALFLALKALGIGPGDEVIVPAFTFVATAFAVTQTGATPVMVDVLQSTHNIDPEEVEKHITKKTRAIIPVHLYGNPSKMDDLCSIAKKHKLFIVEDAAQAHGAVYKHKKLGTWGDVGCFSFYPTKNLGCFGDGGAIVVNNSAIARKVFSLHNYGQEKKYFSDTIGYNSRLDEIQAAFLRVKLKYLDKWSKKRREHANLYKKLLKDIVEIPEETPGSICNYYIFPILTEKRDTLQKFLSENGVATVIHYPIPLHLQKAYTNLGYKKGDFPVSERIAKQTLSLPLFPQMTKKEIYRVVDLVKRFIKK